MKKKLKVLLANEDDAADAAVSMDYLLAMGQYLQLWSMETDHSAYRLIHTSPTEEKLSK